ncbi:hypothetical protein [Streptomyces sp. MA5143a]|uniref:hypothetical protein n=1 Tax=Streptomyces sp. MA5143a TaxID=2083010 RepID=UPI000D1B517C|nr:hypothetical protein [Streptomyces sp. MA5143a]SPF06702.1 hypothetical protein SMA5143A_7542 [Streptomyces sp. MA5143a]
MRTVIKRSTMSSPSTPPSTPRRGRRNAPDLVQGEGVSARIGVGRQACDGQAGTALARSTTVARPCSLRSWADPIAALVIAAIAGIAAIAVKEASSTCCPIPFTDLAEENRHADSCR